MPPSLPAPRLFVLSTIPAQHLWAPRMCPQGMLPPRQGAVCLLTLEAGQLARGGPSGHAPRGGGWPGAPLLPAGAAQCQPCPHPAPSVSAREGGRVRQGAAVYLRHRVPRSLRPGPPVAPSVPSVERGAWLAVGSARQAVGHSLSCTCSPVSRGLPRRGAHPASVTPHAGRVVRLLLTPRVRAEGTSSPLLAGLTPGAGLSAPHSGAPASSPVCRSMPDPLWPLWRPLHHSGLGPSTRRPCEGTAGLGEPPRPHTAASPPLSDALPTSVLGQSSGHTGLVSRGDDFRASSARLTEPPRPRLFSLAVF
ncbi:translation initiation factor IF-2-like isoform X2 [Molossus molossus]|uniref:translation initiation factor IF-2-like isoform X2 n=1 Tax=Molossus molossus TaxID=27622 RepID=UPI0017463C3D|nr:translation initiation factor IF-2-like isoform X2 [Molossus molossus]